MGLAHESRLECFLTFIASICWSLNNSAEGAVLKKDDGVPSPFRLQLMLQASSTVYVR